MPCYYLLDDTALSKNRLVKYKSIFDNVNSSLGISYQYGAQLGPNSSFAQGPFFQKKAG